MCLLLAEIVVPFVWVCPCDGFAEWRDSRWFASCGECEMCSFLSEVHAEAFSAENNRAEFAALAWREKKWPASTYSWNESSLARWQTETYVFLILPWLIIKNKVSVFEPIFQNLLHAIHIFFVYFVQVYKPARTFNFSFHISTTYMGF